MKNGENKKTNNPEFWKSLKEYYNDPEVLKAKANEFADGVTDDFDPSEMSRVSRRKFLALLSASAAFTATACSDYRDKGDVVPYNVRPEGVLPGKANYYASTCSGCSQSCGILVKTREGRPIKIDGNSDHPVNKGKTCAIGQASILNLYDPERLQQPIIDKRKSSWKKADTEIISALKESMAEKKEIALITHQTDSQTEKKVLDDFVAAYPNTKIYTYELFDSGNRYDGWKKAYGVTPLPSIMWDKANVILSLDADFLGNEGNYIEAMRKYSSRRDAVNNASFNRFYIAEAGLSLTGMSADYRFRLSPDLQLEFILSLLNEIVSNDPAMRTKLNSAAFDLIFRNSLEKFAEKSGLDYGKLVNLVIDFKNNAGKSIVYAGDKLSPDVHYAVNLFNYVLGNNNLYDYKSVFTNRLELSDNKDLKNLVESMNNGMVGAVIHYDTNPVYHFPPELDYAAALKNVKTSITLSELPNESIAASYYAVPINHYLESWGDSNPRVGIYSLKQPVVAPIFGTRQKESILLTWIIGKTEAYSEDIYHSYLMENFKDSVYDKTDSAATFNHFWNTALHDGIISIDESARPPVDFDMANINLLKPSTASGGFTVILNKNYYLGDGRFSNNGWLQETPHPVTKVAWDNYASIAPNTAKTLGVEFGDFVRIKVDERNVDLPVVVQPGLIENFVSVELGYGRENSGEVANGVGFNVNVLLQFNGKSKWIINNAEVAKTGESYELVSTQEHHALDDESVKDFHKIRGIIKEGTVSEYKKNPGFIKEHDHELFGITRGHEYNDVKWAMSIDLNKCTSCSACITACNVENNIPVVGKDQVGRGREMHWIRLDRYYSGTPEEPKVSNQPMLCQHCDNAPCENVCPVNATNHSPDGLNQMVYNRCVGTRYCANNCPYKVRRFNFYDFRDHFADAYYQNDLTDLTNNPEVTVRSRGVMEKCTFCVQRIMEARSESIKDGRKLKGSDVQTACQQVCPADAIVFGDVNEEGSEIQKYREHELGYHVLEELYVKPNVTYIAKLRNTHSSEDV
ncbi:MAG: TAT-variant-translocated molybdopterin oxidoreductase [Melioribacteraceae bacterium]|nr:TAT-variant-translocated molybdopterin oxidoreductase [Melioribacteraceae bacterium]MCF8354405.1 TAT-variant-translocated molybdopterin oxidoreductase [Melioribacteraceae bacterium]MCF8392998.1 TAT-variant-translocated molybdopterin oxidoreductase [Melioribacteraceae bacterium]MCF8417259.1 TAT-variant-translocated molybdopterin oxidoreductase [Melioribacteraceae bacterium]